VNLRIEGSTTTIYEGPINSGPRNITTASGGTHLCDGTNNGQNPQPGNTPTDALDAAAKLEGFTYDGTWDAAFDDYSITSIDGVTQTATEFWGILGKAPLLRLAIPVSLSKLCFPCPNSDFPPDNYQFTPTSGCQFEVAPNDDVLWAFNAFNANYFLKVTPASATMTVGQTVVFTIQDGTTGVDIPSASFAGLTSNANGQVTYTATTPGCYSFKASRSDSIRSNAVSINVSS
jgi:hypothetical protein